MSQSKPKAKGDNELVDNETFLARLTSLFEAKKEKGSVWLTHKRYTYDGADTAMAAPSSEQEYPCLLRASDGHTANFSTKIQPGDLPKFNAAYGTLLKSSMTTLRKRDKKKEKRKAEAAALRKKKLMEPITVLGSKRGNGRRKRQRRIKAVIKQDEARKRFEEREEVKTRGTTY